MAKRAFTLVELMIAVVVLGFGLNFVLQSHLASLKGLEMTENYVNSLVLGQKKLIDLELEAIANKGLTVNQSLSGTTFIKNKKYTWQTQTNEITSPYYLSGENLVASVSINWQERGKSKSFDFATYLKQKEEPKENITQENK